MWDAGTSNYHQPNSPQAIATQASGGCQIGAAAPIDNSSLI